ncbi:ubiquitin carboxyl-terminal hydrolase 40-like isoform X2 [Mytilus californianus]|uniref:ubiquitin carboxyl-terminal hydrolase 40-like isoform X2 n=1 Tax=Mytilus californianus TaxID=6549 RepID=UPI0022481277|nr:ubiquitin carboxyl-terminal hydrolase 40-like isoform X2 [Mytilus californianus]
MLEGLFGEEDLTSSKISEPSKPGIQSPPRPRYQCGLAGISNQGATCYLNSLLQTLLYTPEFRESLFDLTEHELGSFDSKDIPGKKARVIPLQLQKLFTRLLLSNQQSISTTELTDSFGWNNKEELQQHDVQELNRILFSAVEASLVGTSGKDLINRLYHGTLVNQIICSVCGKVSEREEDYLDLTLTVAGNNSLEEALCGSFVDMESMDGKNQYKCESCNKLVNAKKGAKLRSLPEILSISFLRFSFDYQKMERYKEAGRLVFPHTIDMAPYCEKEDHSSEYELFSVVIHKGGAYGGHYHAFIKDVDSLGKWTHPDEEIIQLPTDPSTGEVDYIEVDSPVELIQAILVRNPVLTIDKLCAEISKQTGVSWNKRFRKNFGPIVKFLEKNHEVFVFDPGSNHVSLGNSTKVTGDKEQNSPTATAEPRNKRPQSPTPMPGQAWFNFDDSRVSPIREKEIEKQYQGKESAYMLFYRRKTLTRPIEAEGNPAYKVPDNLVTDIIIENDELSRKRQEYEIEVNTITVQIHFSQSYQYYSGALHPRPDQCGWMELTVDRRKTIADLKIAVTELGGELVPEIFVIQRLKELPAGHHLYEFLSGDDSKQIKDITIDDGTMLFIWDGHQVNGTTVPSGLEYEPILLNISYGNDQLFIRGFSKSLTLEQFKVIVSEESRIRTKDLRLKRIVNQDTNPKLIDFSSDLLDTTLETLRLKNGDEIIVEDKSEQSVSDRTFQNKMKMTYPIYIENRCSNILHDDNKRIRLEVTADMIVSEVKCIAVSKFCMNNIVDGGRLRHDHETLGLRSPIYENMTLTEANITKGSNLVLESGPAPSTNQMTLTFTPGDLRSDLSDLEVTVDKMTTVGDCLQCMILKAGFTDDDWHLQKTNWCGEPAEVLDDLDLTLEMSLVNHGDHLLLVKGKLPPKGFVRIPIWLYPSPRKPFCDSANNTGNGMFSWLTNQIQGLFRSDSKSQDTSTTSEEPLYLGDIEVALVMTLEEFKFQILTLPSLSGLSLPTHGFLRVTMVESGYLSTVLKGTSQTLQKLKVKSCNKLAVQILDEEENLNVNQMVLYIKQRIPNTREYLPSVEIIWDTSQGPTINSLQKTIADRLFIPPEHLGMAKHFSKRFDWLIIRECPNKSGGKGKKKVQKTNLRHSPYNLQDGDIIGIKNLQLDFERKEDYCTIEDDQGKIELQKQTEEKKKQREERKKYQDALDSTLSRSRRPEVSLTIKVDDFR